MIGFHKVLIGSAILFFAMFAFLQAIIYMGGGGSGLTLALAIGSGVAAAALAYYLKNLKRFVGRTADHSPPSGGGIR